MSPARRPSGRDTAAPVPGLKARQGAAAILAGVLDRGQPISETLAGGSAAERAEARRVADLALRRLPSLDRALSERMDRLPQPPTIHVMRVMAAELLFGGVSAHAAVDLAVRQVKAGPTPRLAGLVNAVGRRLAEEGPPPPAPGPRPETVPPWLWDALVADWGGETAAAIAEAHLAPPPLDLTLADAGDAEALAAETGGLALPGGTVRVPGRTQVSAIPGYDRGAWWVQDAAAAMPARLLGDVAGLRVLDLCAAPGGKTLQLAATGARVTALDRSEARLERLGENLARTGLTAEVVAADALDWTPEAPFDAILLDAPCSATGTIRRHPDLPHRFDPATLDSLTGLQSRLLDRAWEWLAPGGTLVYATCSILRAEGEAQAAAFRTRHAPEPRPVEDDFATAEGDLRTLPCDWSDIGGLDGFFAARFVKGAATTAPLVPEAAGR